MQVSELFIARAHAAVSAITPVGSADPNGSGNMNTTVSNAGTAIVNFLFLLGGVLAVIYLLWCGIQYITAGGNADRAKGARQGIVNAIFGIIVMMAAYAIIRFAVGLGRSASGLENGRATSTSRSSGTTTRGSTTGSTSSQSQTGSTQSSPG